MINYLVTSRGSTTMRTYVNAWGSDPGSRIRYLMYHSLPETPFLSPGTYIFSDLERLSPPELELARRVWDTLFAAGPRVRLLNNPHRVLCRYDLLRALYEKGGNRFRVFRASEPLDSVRFPVFLRQENDHNGNLTPLLQTPEELTTALRSLRLTGHRLRDLIIVEFCDTSGSDGIFRKYSAFRIGGEILPRHMLFSANWNVKNPDRKDPAFLKEQEEYLNGSPHREWLKDVFEFSGIDYGRIDYGLAGNEPQVWEINTNPTVRKLTPRLTSALEAVDCPSESPEKIPLRIDPGLVRAVKAEERALRRLMLFRQVAGSLSSIQWVRPIIPFAKSLLRASAGRAKDNTASTGTPPSRRS